MNSFYTKYRKPASVAVFILVMGGLMAYSKLQISLFPEITFPKIKVIADAGQLPVDQMMLTVTRPIELAIKKVPGLVTLRSSTNRGSCEISAFMEWNSDIDISQQRIESKINEIRSELPPDVMVTVERMNPSILPVIGYTMKSKGYSPIDLKYLATYTVKPFLSQVEGVSEIRVIGGKEKEYWVILNQQRMSMLGITPDVVRSALNNTGFVKSNGYLSDYRMLYLTVTDATIESKQQLDNLVISNNGRRIILLKDIADIEIREAKEYVRINAAGSDAILIAVIKQPDANLVELSDLMKSKLSDLRQILPANVDIQPYYVQADFVKDSVRSVNDSLWVGLLLAIIVAVLFLRSLKASTTILITIPITLLLSLIVFRIAGQTLNIMTLGAMAASIGLIIDDAIVVVEQIHRTHEECPGEKSDALVSTAIRYLFPAMVGSSLSTIVIFFPFTLMTGVAGAYFKVMTGSMIIILTCSFFVTWVLLPVIYLLLTPKNESGKNRVKAAHNVRQQKWVSYFINRPWISLAFIIFLIAFAAFAFQRLETGFLPEMDEGSIVLDYKSPPGTSLEETDEILHHVEKIIMEIPEVEAYSRRTGTEMGFFITEPNDGDYLIQLKKNRKRSTEEVIEEIREKVEATQPSLQIDFGQVIGDMLGDLMESVQPIEVKIFGPDRTRLDQLSVQIADIVSNTNGTADVFDGNIITGPYVDIRPESVRLAQFGLTPADLQYQLQTMLEGNVEGYVVEKERLTDIRLIYPNSGKCNINDIRHSQVFINDGKLVPLSTLAKISLIEGDPQLKRENLENMGVVTARLSSRDLGSVMSDIQKAVTSEIKLPQGYSIEYGGAFKEQRRNFRELLIILLAASLLVFCVILGLFREFRIAITIILISLLGVTGSYIALYITGTPLNVGSYTGLIMIVGIIGENAIFTYLQFREANKTISTDDSIVFAISTRLRPKLMTALGAIVALLPIAFGIGAGSQMHQPMAISIIGGFIVALPLLLIILPTLLRQIKRTRVHNGDL